MNENALRPPESPRRLASADMTMMGDISWALRASRDAPLGDGFKAWRMRAQLLTSALFNLAAVSRLRKAPTGSSLARLFAERPDTFGVFVWPYQCSAWRARERLHRIFSHCAAVDALGAPFVFSIKERMVLIELDEIMAGARIVLDQPEWFAREGGLALNIFVDDYRAYTLAFSFFREDEGEAIEAYIGAVQGRDQKDALDLYRSLTKKCFGMRPRDFLIEAFGMVCRLAGVKRILCVSDAYRHHRHPYFNQKEFPVNYDEIWRDRGAVQIDAQTFELDVAARRRELDAVKPKKRSMYRKRYEFLDSVEARLSENLPRAKPVWFPDR